MGTDLFVSWLEALNTHDGDKLAALLSEDGIYEVVPTSSRFTKATAHLAVSSIHDLSSDFAVRLVSIMEEGDRYGVEWEVVGTNDGPIPLLGLPASGRTFTIRAGAFGQIEGGRIKRHREYWDVAGLLAQLGIPPSPQVQFGLAAMAEQVSPTTDDE
jgi:steroid delta-isomerase-like uncharacterized protein